MKLLDKTKFSFIGATKQVFLFTGPTEKPTEVYTVTAQFHEVIIGLFLTGPGVITAPDGTKFMLELVMLPALQAAKQRLLNESQAKVEAANARVQAEMPEDIAWLADLTDADKEFMKRVTKARKNGQRVSYRYPPFAAEVKFGPKPPKPKKPKPDPALGEVVGKYETTGLPAYENDGHVTDTEGCILTRSEADVLIEEDKQAAEQVPVVVLSIPKEDNRNIIVERSKWDEWASASTSQEPDWVEKSIHAFCFIYSILRDDVTNVDFEQTRTREELDNIPGML